ncbi:MAG TPA: arsenical-resistance protein, partial [Corynebacterium pollutisoli]|nr:arsenical-resistance protein [Corynebacterium pollutisoli]
MSFLDRWLPAWILLAMAAGLLIGRTVPGIADLLGSLEIGQISLPIA